MKICYFTGTGNSLQVAKGIGGELLSIPQLMKQGSVTIASDAIGIVCPVYLGGLPLMVQEFLKTATIEADYLFSVLTCGNGGSFAQLQKIADERGLDFAYCNIAIMADNFLPGFEMGQELDALPQKHVEEQIEAIRADVLAHKESRPSAAPPMDPAMAALHKKLLAKYLRRDGAKDYLVTDDCTACGICASVCPADNITVAQDGPTFGERCEVCYACLHACPQNALHLDNEKSAARFRNVTVTLQDLINANS